MTRYREMDRAALDAAYDNQAAVPGYRALIDLRRVRTARLREEVGALVGLAYGSGLRQRLDYFAANVTGSPLLVFVHGGYWQGGDIESAGFVAEGPLQRGFAVAIIEYTVAPEARLAGMVDEIRAALRWLRERSGPLNFNPQRVVLVGHSAGAQLVCMALGEPGVTGGVAISGIYDLEPIRLCYLNEKLDLRLDDVASFSPRAHLPTRPDALLVAVGGAELPELVRQSHDFATACGACYLPLAGHDHFSILDEMALAQGALCTRLDQLAG